MTAHAMKLPRQKTKFCFLLESKHMLPFEYLILFRIPLFASKILGMKSKKVGLLICSKINFCGSQESSKILSIPKSNIHYKQLSL